MPQVFIRCTFGVMGLHWGLIVRKCGASDGLLMMAERGLDAVSPHEDTGQNNRDNNGNNTNCS